MTRTMTATRTTTAPVVRTASIDQPVRDRRVRAQASTRPRVGALEYRQQSPGVSQAEHAGRRGVGFVRACGIAVVTAGLALGLVGLANLRAEAATTPAVGTSVQVEAVYVGE